MKIPVAKTSVGDEWICFEEEDVRKICAEECGDDPRMTRNEMPMLLWRESRPIWTREATYR